MKYIFYLLALITTNECFAQVIINAKPDNGIYLTLKSYKEGVLFLPFSNNSQGPKFREPIGHPNEIWVKTEDSTYKFYFEDIWGYKKADAEWRIYNNNAYRVDDTAEICIYTIPTFVTYSPGEANYFSKDLESPIHPIERKDLEEVYHTNSRFMDYIKNLPWYESVMKWDREKNRFEFINWLH
jgi:hypothetical protein